jgi:energy-coupling factor transporter transmembrane protein EcfT
MSNLMHRSFKMSNDVYAAMRARGFTGEIPIYNVSQMTPTDWLALTETIAVAVAILIVGRWLA